MLSRVERVSKVLPHWQTTCVVLYSGWMPGFIVFPSPSIINPTIIYDSRFPCNRRHRNLRIVLAFSGSVPPSVTPIGEKSGLYHQTGHFHPKGETQMSVSLCPVQKQ